MQFVIACAGGGVLQRWSFEPATAKLDLLQEIDCGGAVGSLAWRAETSTLFAALRSAPYKALHLQADCELKLQVTGEIVLPDNMAYIGLDGARAGLLCASYHGAQIAWVHGTQTQALPTRGAAHACVALGGGRLIVATETLEGSVLCLKGGTADEAWDRREMLRSRWHLDASPRHIACAGDWIFIDNEEQNFIDVCRYAPKTNDLQWLFSAELPYLSADQPWYADIRCTCDGHRLWISERRQSIVHCVDVDVAARTLRWVSSQDAPETPRGIAEQSGYVVICGETASSFSVCHCNPEGEWRELARADCPPRPLWVEFLTGAPHVRPRRLEG